MIRDNRGDGAEREGGEARGDDRFTRQAKEAAHEVAKEAKRQVGDIARKVRDSGEQVLDEQKNRVAKLCGDVCVAMQQAGDTLEEKGDHLLASYAHAIADRSDTACHYIEQHSGRDLFRQVQDFASRRPEVFLGAMFLAGLAAARFFKASGQEPWEAAGGTTQEAGEEEFDTTKMGMGPYGASDGIYPESGTAEVEAGGLPSEPVEMEGGDGPPAHFAQPHESDIPEAPRREGQEEI